MLGWRPIPPAIAKAPVQRTETAFVASLSGFDRLAEAGRLIDYTT